MSGLIGGGRNPYRTALGGLRRALVMVGLFSAAVNILMLTGPMFMLQVYDRVLSSGSVSTLIGLFVVVVVLYAFLGIYDFLRIRVLSRAAHRLDQSVGRHLFQYWVQSGLQANAPLRKPLGDLSVVRGFMSSPSVPAFFDLPWVPFYLAIVFFIHPWLGILALFGAGVVTVLALLNQLLTKEPLAKAMQMDTNESFFVEQSQRTAEAVLPMGMLSNMTGHWSEMHKSGLATGQQGTERGEGFSASSKAFRMLLQSSMLGLGGYLALQQEISAGMIVATSIIAGRALAPIDQVLGQWKGVVRAREAHRRLKMVFDEMPEPTPPFDLPAPEGHLSLSNVTKFNRSAGQRTDTPPILSNVSFELSPGDGLGVIGPSTSGKTSLGRLIIGAWKADSGEVRLDGATLDQWSPDSLGKFIGYLPQSVELLAGTIHENIARFDPEADEEKVIEAARTSGVHEMILKLPEGYQTKLGYGPSILSGGQKQRIGLARALYGQPKLIVLDEPNANLDSSGDEALTNAITKMRDLGSVVVVMAHRPSAIAAVNKVLVMHEGVVAQFGDKSEVLQSGPQRVAAVAGDTR